MKKRQLKTRWFSGWQPEVGRALAGLPEMETCPHELLERLLGTTTGAEKRAAVVTEGGDPVAVFGLVRRDRHWQPLGEIPYLLGAGRMEDLLPALRALGVYVRVWGWRHPVDEQGLTHVQHVPDYFAPTDTNWDSAWLELRQAGTVAKARKRCERLGGIELERDSDEAVRWTIDRWAEKWNAHYSDMGAIAADLLTTATYLKAHGRYHSFRLLHNGTPVAGDNWFAAGDRLVSHTTAFDPAYQWYGVGVHMTELALRWSSSTPYRHVGLGAGGAYKAKWLRPHGSCTHLSVMPGHMRLMQWGRDWARAVMAAGGASRRGDDHALPIDGSVE